MAENTNEAPGKKGDEPVFAIQRIYVKDLSFESPSAPEIFKGDWKPDINLDLQTRAQALEPDHHEVVLHLTVTAKQGEKTAFLVEIHQAGIFVISGFTEEQQKHALGAMCPNILYPFAREAVTYAVTHGGFPQLVLAPVNFEALFMQHLNANKGAA